MSSTPTSSQLRRQGEFRRTDAGPVCNTNTTATYDGAELRPHIGRPGAMQAHALPSRTGGHLHHPDGRVTDLAVDLASNPLNDSRSTP